FKVYTYPAQSALGMTPGSGFAGSDVTIRGKNFGNLTQAVKVYFGGVKADTVRSCTDSVIVVKVPLNALSGNVSLQVWTTVNDSVGVFTVIPLPVLTAVVSEGPISPIIAEPGDTVLLRGSHFLTDPSKVSVDFNGTAATNIVSLQDTLITVIAPSGYSAGNVSVTFSGLKLTGTALAPGLPQGDISSFYLKNYKQPFTSNGMTSAQKGSSGKWATPDYWTVNAAGQNQINSGATARCGGLSYQNFSTGELILQAGWGDATGNTLQNAKVYQTISLPAGNYSLVVNINNFGFVSGSTTYIVAATGSGLPDIGDVPTSSLAYTNFSTASSSNSATTTTLNFTLTQYTTLSIGFVSTQLPNSWFRVGSVQLNLLP
ncbi:MAG TPA: DUF5013 domain-containing protein, partial [Puia sp.]